MDWTIFYTATGSVATVVAFVYAMFRNFKLDFNGKFDKLEGDFNGKFDKLEVKVDKIGEDVSEIKARVARLEGQDEERFRSEIRMIIGNGKK